MEKVTIFDVAVMYTSAMIDGRTRARYEKVIADWLKWCGQNAVDQTNPGRFAIEMYGRYRYEVDGCAKTTVRGELGVICGLYRYAYEEGCSDRDWGEHVRRPRIWNHSEGTFLDADQARDFVKALEHEKDDVKALCRLMLFHGLRLGETVGIDVDDCAAREDGMTISVKRRGGWRQVIAVPSKTHMIISRLLARRSTGPLIRNRGKRMSSDFARSSVSRIAQSIGVEGITPHSLRRTFCTLAREAGVPDPDIMAAGGWSNPAMLDYYDMSRRGRSTNVSMELEEYLRSAGS